LQQVETTTGKLPYSTGQTKGNGLSQLFCGTVVVSVEESVELNVDPAVVGSVEVESEDNEVSVTEDKELVEKLGQVATL
jgi:hypothetical protein